jgi:hypothetical protein
VVSDQSVSSASPAGRRTLWHILIGVSLYWLSTALVVFPWTLSKALGIATMLLSTALWGCMAFYALQHAPRSQWTRDAVSMALSFLITGVLQDYLLYALYRGVPDELYEPTTFLAYALSFVLPIAVRYLVPERYRSRPVLPVTNGKLWATVIVGVPSFLFTVWSMRYW